MRRTPLLLLLPALLIIIGGTALWWWTVRQMAAGFAAWQATATAEGWSVHAGPPRAAGWPLAAELAIPDLTLTGGLGSWTAERAVLHLSPLHPERLEVRLGGVQRLALPGLQPATFVADPFVLTAPLRRAGPVQLEGRRLDFTGALAGMRVGLLQGQVQPGTPLAVGLSGEAIALPATARPALGARIASATIGGVIEGALPPATLAPAAAAAAWRGAGGRIEVQHLAVGWGPLGVTGTARLGLDAALQPEGTATLRAVGYDAALTALVGNGSLGAPAAQAIRAVLGLMAETPEGGGAPEVSLPLRLHSGSLLLGRIPVGRLPPWVWPDAPCCAMDAP